MVYVGKPKYLERRKGGRPTQFETHLEMAKISWAPVLECLSLLDSQKYKSIEDIPQSKGVPNIDLGKHVIKIEKMRPHKKIEQQKLTAFIMPQGAVNRQQDADRLLTDLRTIHAMNIIVVDDHTRKHRDAIFEDVRTLRILTADIYAGAAAGLESGRVSESGRQEQHGTFPSRRRAMRPLTSSRRRCVEHGSRGTRGQRVRP